VTRGQILRTAERLTLYAQRAQAHLKTLDRRKDQEALADLAETNEISKRLYNAIVEDLKTGRQYGNQPRQPQREAAKHARPQKPG
jgi:hypothetical protein